MKYFFFLILLLLINDQSHSKKKMNVDGKYYECKSPKNSFERTRGVRSRICFFSKEDKNEIDKRIKNKKSNLKRRFIKH